ncbi:MAG TPA: DNA replication and repair protein RecF [Candidatus Dojkabacteria bacterium]|nr:DNA replication and repair protein RecF [Candidatus Dojkabacteria bacterium]
MIKKIKLTNFRKFKKFEIDIEKDIVVLHGDNAVGKSTILEAIYLITNGKSPWAVSDEYIKTEQNSDVSYCRAEITMDGDEEKVYSYYKSPTSRVLKINEKNSPAKKFFEETASTIFNPEKIEILMISPSKRREFLDEILSTLDYEYVETLKDFRKVLTQRNAYLKKLSKQFYEKGAIARNDPQLNFWTKEFLKYAERIQEMRIVLSKRMKTKDLKIEYIKSNGDIALEDALEKSKKRDIATGYTNVGPHRDDWELINGKNIKKYGSRGEKRLSIGKLIFEVQNIMKKELGYYPILLLDDIASELDEKNTAEIFKSEILNKQQTFITIIDYKHLPKEVLKEAQLVDLNKF